MAKADIWMPFYVADYLADTMHLTAAEHGAYLMLICHYWKTGPLPNDATRLSIISKLGDAWSISSGTLLAFFEQCDGMLVHRRIDKEKADAIDNKAKNQARAQDAANKRWGKHASSNAQSMRQAMPESCPSPSPSPSLKSKSNTTPDGELFPNVSDQIISDFKAMRSQQKAKITKTVLDGINREALKAGVSLEDALRICCERGWRGFKSEWILEPARGSPKKEKFDPLAYINRNRKQNNEPPTFDADSGKPV